MTGSRYNRQQKLQGFGPEGQQRLERARVLVVGAGGLGVPVSQYLAAMGVGTLGIIDGDRVETSNLHRQPAYTPADVGQLKVDVLQEVLHRQNPDITIRAYPEFLEPSKVSNLLLAYDLVVDATDRIPVRYLLDDACVLRGIPWVYGALHGFEGQVSVFNYQEGPTYRCLFPKMPKAGEIPDCNTLGTLGVLPGIIGTLQALEAVKVLCGIGEVLRGKLLLYNALDQRMQAIAFPRNPQQQPRRLDANAYQYVASCGPGTGISLSEYQERKAGGEAHLLVDVREPEEFDRAHLPDAINIPLGNLKPDQPEFRQTPHIYFYCKSGSRSAQACQRLEGLLDGVTLYSIEEGMHTFFNLDNEKI
ncbi:HesA/MoeB/ThiF family protein [Robiginitalea sp. M366]|uniref:HesA/MoeB/ThiF family protein n=1 Tax=Robiginitalea aestuariiviva TaxID=3036903 RepID=UPI00240E5B98|nr:HesA/MoeB/ThiF family protein [Robiginitalea aestuariiviva]MDG1572922.1 HesA/MoeB/ThiF family protein [Robiginitalea aestuariiviva]